MTPITGWHNLALSPEDALSPRGGSAPLHRHPDDPRWLFQVVGTCASLLGLWRGQTGGPLDDEMALPGAQVMPVRAFSRSLSAGSVERELEARLIAVNEHYPVPRVDSSTAVAAEDEVASATGMADSVIDKHAESVMPRARTSPPPVAPTEIKLLQALGMFFRFLWDALRNAPRRMADAFVREASTQVAGAAQRIVFGGNDSGFAVVVKGVRADGSLASWGEVESGLESVMQRTAPGSELGTPPQAPGLWRDFVDAGMTLLDAGSRSADLAPRTHGASRAVLTSTDRVAPPPGQAFTLPPNLAAHLTGWTIEVADDIAGGLLQQRLEELKRTTPHLAHELGAEQHRLAQWRSRATSSYVGRIGARMGEAFRDLVAEVQGLTARLASLREAPDSLDQIAEDQDRLGRRLRWLTVAGVVAVIGLAVLVGLGILGLLIGTALVLASLVGWLVAGTIMFLRTQKRLFAMLHASRQSASDLETTQGHLTEALEDMRRLSRAYRQYLDWARAFGAFVNAPLGRPAEEETQDLFVGEGLPRAVSMGVAVPDVDSIDEVCNRWRPRLFEAGWLSECWEEFIADVPVSLGDARYQIASTPEILWHDTNLDGRGSILTRWSAVVAENARDRPMSERFRKRVQELVSQDDESRATLLATVSTVDSHSGAEQHTTRTEFLSGFESADGLPAQTFLGTMFAPHAGDARQVARTTIVHQHTGLTQASVAVQLGAGSTTEAYVSAPSLPGVMAPLNGDTERESDFGSVTPNGPWT